MVLPDKLQAGDTIAIVSTARKISMEEITPSIKLIEAWGYKVKIGKSITAEKDQFAGDEPLRASDFQAMIDDPEVKAILCARGGYGTVRIIDKLDFSAFKKQAKWIMGYSDVTVLHSHLHTLGYASIHSTMPINFPESGSDSATDSLESVLRTHAFEYEIESNHPFNRKGTVQGQLVGGNLSILYSLLGSPSSIDTKGKVLFIEDLDEYLYHIDRMMMNIKRNGYLDGLSGLVIGGMSDMNDNTIPYGKDAKEIILEHCAAFDFPILFDFPAGHIDDNRAIILGKKVELSVNETSYLKSID